MSLLKFTLSLFFVLGGISLSPQSWADDLAQRLKEKGELAPFPEAKELLVEVAAAADSRDLKKLIEKSSSLKILREKLRTSLFHLNLQFDIESEDYPYEAPFEAPFPFRPTLEVLDEAKEFFEIVAMSYPYRSPLIEKIEKYPAFKHLKTFFPKAKKQPKTKPISKKSLAQNAVDAYEAMTQRLIDFGEVASFPEFEPAVRGLLTSLQEDEDVKRFTKEDASFRALVEKSKEELGLLGKPKDSQQDRLHGKFKGPYPYRRTLQYLERATFVLDMKERLKYPEGISWYDVEVSWFVGDQPKLLPLYHFNRYKYQLAGLLPNHEVVLLPDWGGAGFEYLIRLRAAPFGILEMSPKTERVDRHHNSPIDNLYHDANHVRRMWGYDLRKLRKRGAHTRQEKLAVFREQEAFIQKFLEHTNLKVAQPRSFEKDLRKYMRVLFFETVHETALTPDIESLLYDLLRKPATRQPFEVQFQAPISDLELIRRFDGNLRSGADQLGLNMDSPTTVRYFMDRAPGFLANVDNKARWGFFDPVFDMRNYMPSSGARTPIALAMAADRLFTFLGHEAPPREQLTSWIVDRSGQQELWSYFSIPDVPIVRDSSINVLYVAAASLIHETWRLNAAYKERWMATEAKLSDGTLVNDEWTLGLYIMEKQVPRFLWKYYKIDKDPATGEPVLHEDIRNLPHKYLSQYHQGENVISGAKSVAIVNRIWAKELKFDNLDQVERWLVAASQTVHQAVLDRNANGARNNPIYNVHWLQLPARNQINDLQLVRLGLEARIEKSKENIPEKTVEMVKEGISRLYRKIRGNEYIGYCAHSLAVKRRDSFKDSN